jgi:hypothetical protein
MFTPERMFATLAGALQARYYGFPNSTNAERTMRLCPFEQLHDAPNRNSGTTGNSL